MNYFIIIFPILLILLVTLICFVKYDVLKIRQTLLRTVVPKISYNIKKGVINYNSLQWCTLPLSTYNDGQSIPNGLMDITHPTIAYIKNSWNGYTHWMGASPYPQSLPTAGAKYENTCIFHANILNNNPIAFIPIENNPIIRIDEAQYNSDPDLFYDIESNRLFCITRKRNGPDYVTKIVLQYSCDGQSWSVPFPIITLLDNCQFLSPCLMRFNNKYRIYAFQADSNNRSKTTTIDIWESDSIIDPNFIFYKSSFWNAPMNIWHGGLLEYNKKLYLIFCGSHNNYRYLTGNKDVSKYLFLGFSEDGENFSFYDNPLLKMNGVYRSSAFVDENGLLVCYVSLHNRYHGEKQYASGHRIGMFEFPFDILTMILKENNSTN